MPKRNVPRALCSWTAAGWVALALARGDGAAQTGSAAPQPHRSITVRDLIEWSRFAEKGYRDVGVTSPNQAEVALVVEHGDLSRNLVVSTLVVLHMRGSSSAPAADTVAVLASGSNRPAISQVRWLSDSRTIAFLGEHGEQGDTLRQVYTVDIQSRRLTQVTHHPAALSGFAMAKGDYPVVYMAQSVPDSSLYTSRLQHGFAVEASQTAPALAAGELLSTGWTQGYDVFQLAGPRAAPKRLRTPNTTVAADCADWLTLSPDGTVAVMTCHLRQVPKEWTEYTIGEVRRWARDQEQRSLLQYVAVSMTGDGYRLLMNAPSVFTEYSGSEFPWASEGHSVALGNVPLPLDVQDTGEREWRRSHTAVADIDAQTGQVSVVSRRQPMVVKRWIGSDTLEVTQGGGYVGSDTAMKESKSAIRMVRTSTGWREAGAAPEPGGRLDIAVDQDMNTPPHLVLVVHPSGERRVIYDPEPRLQQRYAFAQERLIHWRSTRGLRWQGGLFIPPNYDPHRRYPLVIQTHDFSPTQWDPEGPYTTAYAAQALASTRIMVLQIGDDNVDSVENTLREAPLQQEAIEGVIDSLARAGVIDRARVGLQGFSRTCYPVLYMVTHPRFPVAAAVVSDGPAMSYSDYLLWPHDFAASTAHALYGGPPWGARLRTWLEQAPGFHLEQVNTPLRLEAASAGNSLVFWEEFAGLVRLRKPVEYYILPRGQHQLWKPWERLSSQGGAADWFRFWLRDEEDPDPAKAEQYARWRKMREQRAATARPDSTH